MRAFTAGSFASPASFTSICPRHRSSSCSPSGSAPVAGPCRRLKSSPPCKTPSAAPGSRVAGRPYPPAQVPSGRRPTWNNSKPSSSKAWAWRICGKLRPSELKRTRRKLRPSSIISFPAIRFCVMGARSRSLTPGPGMRGAGRRRNCSSLCPARCPPAWGERSIRNPANLNGAPTRWPIPGRDSSS